MDWPKPPTTVPTLNYLNLAGLAVLYIVESWKSIGIIFYLEIFFFLNNFYFNFTLIWFYWLSYSNLVNWN